MSPRDSALTDSPAAAQAAAHQVLARKWRPQRFADLVGQEHVVKALINALERGQLHHAYLFTGTRGVGKTTIARILAKSLNCEQGVTATPCGVCSSCREIHEGRFIDLQEVDAASRTKVDQTRELLDNVPFAPVRGRYKVYLIDEVHMFSTSSFNALLKTLEEPPPHVKFVLATTDPQKVPATVLSRCLQFNLKHLLPDQIQAQFKRILEAEGVTFEDTALAMLARAAEGSMRDGLSLLDQGIAFGGGQLGVADVRAMLGTLDHDMTLSLVDALCDHDGPRLLAEIGRVAQLTPDFAGVLKAVIELLHRLALAQQVPSTLDAADPDFERLQTLAARVAAEDVQLYYQIAVMGQQDLALAPDPRAGLEMVFLRALAFRPDTESSPSRRTAPSGGPTPGGSAGRDASGNHGGGLGAPTGVPADQAGAAQAGAALTRVAALADRVAEAPPPARSAKQAEATPLPESSPRLESSTTSATPLSHPEPRPAGPADAGAGNAGSRHAANDPTETDPTELGKDPDWHGLVERLPVNGLARQLASHCAFDSWKDDELHLHLEPDCEHLMRADMAEERLTQSLREVLGRPVRLRIEARRAATDTPARRLARAARERQREAEALMRNDPIALGLVARLNAHWVPGSIQATA
jgi:DNA polymerase-3 subunit gamma/tau